MNSKPLIGINTDYRPTRKESPAFSYVFGGYFDSVSKAGGIPVIVPPLESEDDVSRILDRLDGFLLVGGADLDPYRDGLPPVAQNLPRAYLWFTTAAKGGLTAAALAREEVGKRLPEDAVSSLRKRSRPLTEADCRKGKSSSK